MPTSKFFRRIIAIYILQAILMTPMTLRLIFGGSTVVWAAFQEIYPFLFILFILLVVIPTKDESLMRTKWRKHNMQRYCNILAMLTALFTITLSVLITIRVGRAAGITESDSIFLGLKVSMLIFLVDSMIQAIRLDRAMRSYFLSPDHSNN